MAGVGEGESLAGGGKKGTDAAPGRPGDERGGRSEAAAEDKEGGDVAVGASEEVG